MSQFEFNKRLRLKHPLLMIPGPVEVSQSVLAAMGSQCVPDYGTDWIELYTETTEALRAIFNTKGDVFLVVSSGTGGVECAINSMFVRQEKIIVVENGFFGERIATLARQCGLNVISASAEWGLPIEPNHVETILKIESDVAGLIVVHHETSTGILNPIKELAQIAQRFGIPIIVDAVSSLGGEVFEMDDWGIDVAVTSSNKCLESLPGIAPIAVSKSAWNIINKKAELSHGWYLNLQTWKHHSEIWSNWHPYPVTMAVNTVLALNVALEELYAEGKSNRIRRYHSVAQYFRKQLKDRNFDLFVEGSFASSTITAIKRPLDFDIQQAIRYLQENLNIRIAGGLGKTNGSIFRVGHMGRAGSQEYVDLLLKGLYDFMKL